jgi:hypothetical membrane protein
MVKIYLKQDNIIKIAGICGILIPIIAFISIVIAIWLSPWFNFTEYWLSDLAGEEGETPSWAARGISSIIFNVGLILSGVLGIFCVNVLRKIKCFDTPLGKFGVFLLFIDMLSLFFLGLFPITTGEAHGFFSASFFLLLPISLIIVGIIFRKNFYRMLGLSLVGLGCLSLCAFPFLFIDPPYGGNAIIELIPSISISLASMIFGLSILQNKFDFR